MAEQQFKTGSKVVYPSHGVGLITGVETQKIAGQDITLYVVDFERDKMKLRIPVNRAAKSGLRKLCSSKELEKVDSTLKKPAKAGRGMWSRRAKEYEAKINSGNIVSLAEVVRDLHKNVDDPERSYSERVIYENALERLAGEISAIQKMELVEAQSYLIKTINDNQPRSPKLAVVKEDMLEDVAA